MLKEYKESLSSLKEIEFPLLEEDIRILNKALEPGESYNLSSLGISDFIDTCLRAINKFRDKQSKISKSALMIEDIVKGVEDAVLIKEYDFKGANSKTLNDFYYFFESQITEVTIEMSDKYKIIGE